MSDFISIINDSVTEIYPEVVQWRRHFHQHPELSFKEHNTAEFIYQKLRALGCFELERPLDTAVVATLKGPAAGKVIALRADIDALPVNEENDVDYCSLNKGVMHACAHDGHAAALLGVAHILAKHQQLIKGAIKLIFQPAEEIGAGAIKLIDKGILKGLDYLFGVHIWSPLELGKIGICYGPMMAAGDFFKITINGKGGHGAIPQEAIDPVVIGSEIVLSLQTIVSRKINPIRTGLISVTKFDAGSSYNIIPETVTLGGTLRSLDMETMNQLYEWIEKISQQIAQAYGAAVTVSFDSHPNAAPLFNDFAVTKMVEDALIEGIGKDHCQRTDPTLAGEDFSQYTKHGIPACFLFVGTRAEGTDYPHHHPKFNIKEESMLFSMKAFLNIIRKITITQ